MTMMSMKTLALMRRRVMCIAFQQLLQRKCSSTIVNNNNVSLYFTTGPTGSSVQCSVYASTGWTKESYISTTGGRPGYNSHPSVLDHKVLLMPDSLMRPGPMTDVDADNCGRRASNGRHHYHHHQQLQQQQQQRVYVNSVEARRAKARELK